MLDYRIITKEEYKSIRLNSLSASSINKESIKSIEENWDTVRKGYEFIIAVGKRDEPMLYSVDYFNNHVLNGKNKSKTLTIKLNLDITKFEEQLNRLGKKLETINRLGMITDLRKIKPLDIKDALEFEESLNRIKDLAVNEHINMEKDT